MDGLVDKGKEPADALPLPPEAESCLTMRTGEAEACADAKVGWGDLLEPPAVELWLLLNSLVDEGGAVQTLSDPDLCMGIGKGRNNHRI